MIIVLGEPEKVMAENATVAVRAKDCVVALEVWNFFEEIMHDIMLMSNIYEGIMIHFTVKITKYSL